MRYRFRGLRRQSGQPVEGHVEAGSQEEAYAALSDFGIVTESMVPDPKALNLEKDPLPDTPFADALESALDVSSQQVRFDDIADRYKGKTVWVIDRDKIRRRVAQIVDEALSQAQQNSEAVAQTRQRVAIAIESMFRDNKNLTSEVQTNPGLENQVARLAGMIKHCEGILNAVNAAVRRIGVGGGAPRRMAAPEQQREEQNQVLLEIFKSNLELQRTVETLPPIGEPLPAAAPADAQQAAPASPGP